MQDYAGSSMSMQEKWQKEEHRGIQVNDAEYSYTTIYQ